MIVESQIKQVNLQATFMGMTEFLLACLCRCECIIHDHEETETWGLILPIKNESLPCNRQPNIWEI